MPKTTTSVRYAMADTGQADRNQISRLRTELSCVPLISYTLADMTRMTNSPVSIRNKSTDLGDFGAKPENLHTGSVLCAEED